MDLGNVPQLKVYERAIENAVKNGNRDDVVFFGDLICKIAKEKKELKIIESDDLCAKDRLTLEDRKRVAFLYGEMKTYDNWVDLYNCNASRYKEMVSKAGFNFLKRNDSNHP